MRARLGARPRWRALREGLPELDMQLAGYGVALECIIIEEGETSRTSFNSETVFAGVHTLNREKPLYSKCNRGDPRKKPKRSHEAYAN